MNIIPTPFEKGEKRVRVTHPIIEDHVAVVNLPTNIEGLTCKYSFQGNPEHENNLDHPFYPHAGSAAVGNNGELTEFSKDAQNVLLRHFSEIMSKKEKLVIVEIGVQRSLYENSTTYVLFNNKRNNDIYLGIDIRDVSHLNNPAKNIHILTTQSENIQFVMEYLQRVIGMNNIDVLVIDGWHSINQVYKEWEYTKYLSDNGIVVFHDTNSHPGPYFLLKSIDTNKYVVNKYLNDLADWGISVAVKK